MKKGLLLHLYYGFGAVTSYPLSLYVFTAVCWLVVGIVVLALLLRVIAINGLQHKHEVLELELQRDNKDEEWQRWWERVVRVLHNSWLVRVLRIATDHLTRDGEILEVDNQRCLLTLSHVGMASYEREVLGFVRDDRDGAPSLLGIWGMPGVGKTTLLRFVRDSCSHGGSRFSHVFFLGAGTGCTVDRLQHVLSVNIGLPTPHDDAPMEAQVISSYLKPRTFLLLLDDVRERLDLAAVGLPMTLEHRQKVIFTTRYHGICAEMGCTGNTTIRMKCLGEDDAFSLFMEKVGDEIMEISHIKHLANKMVAECRGLPSALCTLGRAMSTKRDVKEWRYAYDVLLKCKPPHQVDEIQEMDQDEGYSHLHQLEDALQDFRLRHPL